MKNFIIVIFYLCCIFYFKDTHTITKDIPKVNFNTVYNLENYSDINNWESRKESPDEVFSFKTHRKKSFYGDEILYFSWCSNHNELTLCAVYNIEEKCYKYNPPFLKLKF